ncbi:MAG TPA: hypothetical protein VLI69_03225 [Gammaproteobacteria bacterium]|nr:hypothetical protein [Gammaproteobacteria bacterium]
MSIIKRFFVLVLLWMGLISLITSANAGPLGQTIQINTRFHSIIGNPVWLLILRDPDTGIVYPYLYDIKNNDNFWLAFSFGQNYVVTVSNLKFGPFAIINNFCHLENRLLTRKSMIISLTGNLTPAPVTSTCHVITYNN